jgi:type IV secretory pathway VirB4 component
MPAFTTQQFLEFEDIREGVIILKDRSLRGILLVSSLNFALKSREEQEAIIYQFQNFLNSLDFPIQILVQSRRVNITGYLEKIEELEKKQKTELLKHQTREYKKFIESLVGAGDIYTKQFFVIVPFYPAELTVGKKKKISLTDETFEKFKLQLWQRLEFVALGLKRCGLQCVPLTTNELIEVFWSFYHSKEAEVGYYPEIPPELIT